MRAQLLLMAGWLAVTAVQGTDPKSDNRTDAAAAFARLKTLVGEWEADTQKGKDHLSYELTGGGTAVVERETAEQMPGMLTVYHLDRDRLILTHYCMAGNQPRMQARAFNPASGDLQFQFLDITNLSSPGAGHMHNVRLRLVDHDHFQSEWQFYEDGKPKFSETATYVRVR